MTSFLPGHMPMQCFIILLQIFIRSIAQSFRGWFMTKRKQLSEFVKIFYDKLSSKDKHSGCLNRFMK